MIIKQAKKMKRKVMMPKKIYKENSGGFIKMKKIIRLVITGGIVGSFIYLLEAKVELPFLNITLNIPAAVKSNSCVHNCGFKV